ncbi:hypothetical protein [Rhizobacter sp. P5_C2]
MITLQREFETFQSELPNLIAKGEGQFVVIRGEQVCDFFPSYGQALAWAYERFGLEPFFVKQIAREEMAAHFTRDLRPCVG